MVSDGSFANRSSSVGVETCRYYFGVRLALVKAFGRMRGGIDEIGATKRPAESIGQPSEVRRDVPPLAAVSISP
jgi:hypothetical protein